MNEQLLYLIHPYSASVQLYPPGLGDIKKNAYYTVPHKYHNRQHYCLMPKITCRLTQIAWVAILQNQQAGMLLRDSMQSSVSVF